MADSDSSADLLSGLRAADPQACEELFDRYSKRLARLAEKHLSPQIAVRADGEDVVQSVFRTFFRRQAVGEFRIDSSVDLWRLLAQITLRKAISQARRHTAATRDVGVEAGGDEPLAATLSREPDPATAILVEEEVTRLLEGLPKWYGKLLEMRLAGHGVGEIAPKLNVSRQTIYRALDLLGKRLQAPAE